MNILFSCIGRHGHIADYFRPYLTKQDKIIGASNSLLTPGFQHCDKGILMPDIESDIYLDTVIAVCKEYPIHAIMSFVDLDVDKLSSIRSHLQEVGVIPVLTSPAVSRICFDKLATQSFLARSGFKTIKTYSSSGKAIEAIRNHDIGFPLFVKPRFGHGSINLLKAHNVAQLKTFHQYAPDMCIQESLPGHEYHLDVLLDLNGKVISVCPKKKVAMRAGETDQAVPCNSRKLTRFAYRLGDKLGELGHVGPVDIDMFVHKGSISVVEMNPRFGGGYPFSHAFGAEFPRLIMAMIRGEKIPRARKCCTDSRCAMKEMTLQLLTRPFLKNFIVDKRK